MELKNRSFQYGNRIFNSDKICRSYSDLNFGVTFLEHSVYYKPAVQLASRRPARHTSLGEATLMIADTMTSDVSR